MVGHDQTAITCPSRRCTRPFLRCQLRDRGPATRWIDLRSVVSVCEREGEGEEDREIVCVSE